MLRRTGPILLAALALVANPTVAQAHTAAPGTSIIGSGGRIHSCYQDILPIFPRRLRVVTETEPCLLTLTIGGTTIPILPIENGVDWPSNGVLTQLVETPPPALPLAVPAGPGATASMTLTCPTNKVVAGLSEFSNVLATGTAALAEINRNPTGNSVTVTFVTMTAHAAVIGNLKALCVTLFAQ